MTDAIGNIDSLLVEAERLIERRDAEALTVANLLMTNAHAEGSSKDLAQATYIMAYYHCLVVNDYEKSIELCENILKNTLDEDLIEIDFKLYMTLGNAFHLKGEVFSAQYWYLKGLKLLEEKKNCSLTERLFLATFYYNLSTIFTNHRLNDSGEDYLLKAIALYSETSSFFKLSKCYSAYANLLEAREDFHTAIDWMNKALELDQKGKDPYSIAISQANLGILKSKVGELPASIELLKESLQYFEKQQKVHEGALVRFNLGRVLCEHSNYKEGIPLLHESEKTFIKLDNRHELTSVYELLSEVVAKQGLYKEALDYHHQYTGNLRHVFDSEKANAVTRAKQEFETEQREKEAALLREKNEEIRMYATSLETAYNDLEALSYSVSHDLKAPLAMVRNINALAPEDESGYRKFIDNTCTQALTSIDNILAISRNLNKSRPLTEYHAEEIDTLIAEKVEELQPGADVKKVELCYSRPDKHIIALVNKETLGRAIANLVGNAVKFSKPGGHVWLETETTDDGWLLIRVKDEGAGIPADLQKHLFTKFSAAQRSGLQGEKGTGLGLFITHSIIKLHGGTICVESEAGKGATFTIRIPLPEHTKA